MMNWEFAAICERPHLLCPYPLYAFNTHDHCTDAARHPHNFLQPADCSESCNLLLSLFQISCNANMDLQEVPASAMQMRVGMCRELHVLAGTLFSYWLCWEQSVLCCMAAWPVSGGDVPQHTTAQGKATEASIHSGLRMSPLCNKFCYVSNLHWLGH